MAYLSNKTEPALTTNISNEYFMDLSTSDFKHIQIADK